MKSTGRRQPTFAGDPETHPPCDGTMPRRCATGCAHRAVDIGMTDAYAAAPRRGEILTMLLYSGQGGPACRSCSRLRFPWSPGGEAQAAIERLSPQEVRVRQDDLAGLRQAGPKIVDLERAAHGRAPCVGGVVAKGLHPQAGHRGGYFPARPDPVLSPELGRRDRGRHRADGALQQQLPLAPRPARATQKNSRARSIRCCSTTRPRSPRRCGTRDLTHREAVLSTRC